MLSRRSTFPLLVLFVLQGLLIVACQPNSSSTSPSHAPAPESHDANPTSVTNFVRSQGAFSLQPAGIYVEATADEEFNCTSIEKRQVRFGTPGSIDANAVRLFYEYEGVPTGAGGKRLVIFWDWGNDRSDKRIVALGDGDVHREDDSRTDYRGFADHTYDVNGPSQRSVRVVLEYGGKTGDCTTVRHITVSPPAGDLRACTNPPAGQVNEPVSAPALYNRPVSFPGPGGGCATFGPPLAPYAIRTFGNCSGAVKSLTVAVQSPNCDPSGSLVYVYSDPTTPTNPQPFDVTDPCRNLINTGFANDGGMFANIPANANVTVVTSFNSIVIPACPAGFDITYTFP